MSELLQDWRLGDQEALARIMDVAYHELHNIAHACLKNERAGHTLRATALVNEAYIRLVNHRRMKWQDRGHFFAISAKIMRRILVDYARARGSRKRGGEVEQVDLSESVLVCNEAAPEILRMNDALQSLERLDPRKAQVVEMRYFAGLTAKEIGAILDLSPKTVDLEWTLAKAWLAREITREEHPRRE